MENNAMSRIEEENGGFPDVESMFGQRSHFKLDHSTKAECNGSLKFEEGIVFGSPLDNKVNGQRSCAGMVNGGHELGLKECNGCGDIQFNADMEEQGSTNAHSCEAEMLGGSVPRQNDKKSSESGTLSPEGESHSLPKALQALESARERYAEELLQWENLRSQIQALERVDKGHNQGTEVRKSDTSVILELNVLKLQPAKQAVHMNAQVEKISQERDKLMEDSELLRESCTTLQRQLEEERREKMEAQSYIAALVETVVAAQKGEANLLQQQVKVLSQQRLLAARIEATSQNRVSHLSDHVSELGSYCDNLIQIQELLTLHNKVWAVLLRCCVQLLLLFYAILIFLAPYMKTGHMSLPT